LNLVFDTIVSVSDLNESFMSWYENLGPFGMGFEVPLLLLKKVKVKKIQVLKGKYLKYTLEQGARTLEAVWFSGAVEFAEGSQVDVLFSPSWNEYRGSRKIQAVITAMREH
jgi:single-stranded-DNA-specific exonuclease